MISLFILMNKGSWVLTLTKAWQGNGKKNSHFSEYGCVWGGQRVLVQKRVMGECWLGTSGTFTGGVSKVLRMSAK